MDNGEPYNISELDEIWCSDLGDLQSSCSMAGHRFEEIRDDNTLACTHTHTCNQPGPDLSHTHTCFHVHTKIVPAPPTTEDERLPLMTTQLSSVDQLTEEKKSPKGRHNREAVRKYREKKKALAKSLEDEVNRLRALNQQLLKRLQGHAALEAEYTKLMYLLVEITGKIEVGIGSIFSYQNSAPIINTAGSSDEHIKNNINIANPNFPGSSIAYVMNMNPCNNSNMMQCDHDQGYSFGGCEFQNNNNLQCLGNMNPGLKEVPNYPGCELENIAESTINSSGSNKGKGVARASTFG